MAEKVAPWALSQYNNELQRATQKEINQLTREMQQETNQENAKLRRHQAEADRALRLEIAKMNNETRKTGLEIRDTQLDKRLDHKAHLLTVKAIRSDKPLQERLRQYTNLDNALSILTQAKHITPQQIHEFQQAIRGNLGIKGSSGIAERHQTYLDSIGLRGRDWAQFLTGSPADIAKNHPFLTHLKELAHIEQTNIQNQFEERLNFLSGGFASMYNRNPTYKQDLDALLKSGISQVSSATPPASTSKPAKISSDKVKVKSPTGQIGLIPKERLQDYLNNQYTLVQ